MRLTTIDRLTSRSLAAFQVYSTMQSKASAIKPMRNKRDMRPLLPFEELVNEADNAEEEFSRQNEDFETNMSEDCILPDPCALLHITNRRKMPLRKKSLPMVMNLVFTFTFAKLKHWQYDSLISF